MHHPSAFAVTRGLLATYFQRIGWYLLATLIAIPSITGLVVYAIEMQDGITTGDFVFTLVAIVQVTVIPLCILSPYRLWELHFSLPVSTRRLFATRLVLSLVLAAASCWLSTHLARWAASSASAWPINRLVLWVVAATALGAAINWSLQRSHGLQGFTALFVSGAFLTALVLLLCWRLNFNQTPQQWFDGFYPWDIVLCLPVAILSCVCAWFGLQRVRYGEDIRRPEWTNQLAKLHGRGEVRQPLSPEFALRWFMLQNGGTIVKWTCPALAIVIACLSVFIPRQNIPGFLVFMPGLCCVVTSVISGTIGGLADAKHKQIGFPAYHAMLPLTDRQIGEVAMRTLVNVAWPIVLVGMSCIAIAGSGWFGQYPLKFPAPGFPAVGFCLVALPLICWAGGSLLLGVCLKRVPDSRFVVLFYPWILSFLFADQVGEIGKMICTGIVWLGLVWTNATIIHKFVQSRRLSLITVNQVWFSLAAALAVAAALAACFHWYGELTPVKIFLSVTAGALVVQGIGSISLGVYQNRHR